VARKEGAFVVLRSKDLTVVHEARDSKHPINAVAWSPDGELLDLDYHYILSRYVF
jgi:hypothetical protein